MIELKKILEIIGNNSKTIDGWGDTIWVDASKVMLEIFNASKNQIALEDIFKDYFSDYKYELKEKLRDMKIGVPRSEEIRKKISLALLGRKLQQKHIDKMKEYYKENSPVNSKKIICLNDKNIFKSIAEASKFYKINSGMIVRVCKKQRNHTHGLVFEYYKEDKND